MAIKSCPSCGAEYIASVATCADCGTDLVESAERTDADTPDGASGDEAVTGNQISYTFEEWGGDGRVLLDHLLGAEDIPHIWEGTTLVVRATDEIRVDRLVEQVEISEQPALDPEAELVVYELEGWSEEKRSTLAERLSAEGVSHGWDEDDNLVVEADDEDEVEAVLDQVDAVQPEAGEGDPLTRIDPEADAEADEAAEAGEANEAELQTGGGRDAQEVLSDLFVSADRLMHHPKDRDDAAILSRAASDAAAMDLPYGFDPKIWRDLVERSEALRDLLAAEDLDEVAVADTAKALRAHLRIYV